MWGKCQENVRKKWGIFRMCGIDVRKRAFAEIPHIGKMWGIFLLIFPAPTSVWKNVRKFISANSTHSKCEEILSSHFPMWGKDFLTLENVRKSFLHIGKCEEILSSHWKMWRKDFSHWPNVRNYSNLFWVIVRILFFFGRALLMWVFDFLTVENVRICMPMKFQCEENVRKKWGIFHMCGIDVRKRAFAEIPHIGKMWGIFRLIFQLGRLCGKMWGNLL